LPDKISNKLNNNRIEDLDGVYLVKLILQKLNKKIVSRNCISNNCNVKYCKNNNVKRNNWIRLGEKIKNLSGKSRKLIVRINKEIKGINRKGRKNSNNPLPLPLLKNNRTLNKIKLIVECLAI
jgi:hypothetical protein